MLFGLLGTITAVIVFWQSLQAGSGIVISLIVATLAGLAVNFLMNIVGFVLSLIVGVLAGIASLFRRGE